MEHKRDSNPSSSEWRKSGFMDKLRHVLTHGILTDLTIRLINGADIKEFRVHSIFFAMASEVFERMLQSSFKEGLTRIIEMKDVKPETFNLLLNYLYGQPLDLSNSDLIKDLTELANYYMMDGLKTEIINYCEKNETDGVAWIGFEVAEICDAPSLKDSKLKYITNNTQTVVNHQNFLKANAETIKTVFDQDYLNIEEIDLFRALEKWIKHNITGTDESLKEILIRKVRYFSMTLQEFVSGPVSSQLLKSDDSLPLMSHLVDGNCLIPLPEGFTNVKRSSSHNGNCLIPLPEGFTNVKRSSSHNGNCLIPLPLGFTKVESFSSHNHLMLTSLPSFYCGRSNYYMAVQVSKNIWLTHLIIYPLITNGEYKEEIPFYDYTDDPIKEIAKFEGIVNGSDNIEVELKQPLLLEAGRTYKISICVNAGTRKCVKLPGNVLNSGDVSFSFKYSGLLSPRFPSRFPLNSILFTF